MSFNGVVPAESCLSKIPPLQNPVFIADLHLAADKPATKEAFFKFLKNDAARFSELVILGDLFEFWAGDDHAPAYADILEALKAFFLNGHRIYVMHGNRDFLLGKGFTAATGAQLIADPIPVQVGFDHILCPTAICGARLILNISSSVRPCAAPMSSVRSSVKNLNTVSLWPEACAIRAPMTTKKKQGSHGCRRQ